MSYNARWVRPLAFQRWVRAAKAYPTTSMAGQVRALWRKASQRKAIGESPTERRRNERQPTKACLPRHGPFAHPVCVAARKPHFRPGNPPRHVRISTSVCVAAQKPHFRPGNPSRHIRSGTSVCAATSGDDPSSSTSAQRGAPVTARKMATGEIATREMATRRGEHSLPERRPPAK